MKNLVILLILVFTGTSFGLRGSGNLSNSRRSRAAQKESICRFWCKSPENEIYCCEKVEKPQANSGKPGKCPSIRYNCTRLNKLTIKPFLCSSDMVCHGKEKCCYDRCLKHHICKPVA